MILRTLNIAAGLALIFTGALAQAPAEPLPGRIFVIDGDTLWHYPAAGTAPEKIRLLNIDAPETRNAVCEAERVAGYRAKEALSEALKAPSSPVTITRCEASGRCADVYGRTLGRILIDGKDAGSALLAKGLALPWKPGAQAKFERQQHWCGGK